MDITVMKDLESWADEKYRVFPNPPEPWQIIDDHDDPDIRY